MDRGWVRDATLIVLAYCVLGLGLGVAGFVGLDWVAGATASGAVTSAFTDVAFVQSVVAVFFAGPTVAALAGLAVGQTDRGVRDAARVAGVGTFVGFYPMVALAVLVMSFALGTPNGSADLAGHLGTVLLAGVPTGLVGAACGVVGTRFVDDAGHDPVAALSE